MTRATQTEADTPASLVKSQNALALDLYRAVRNQPGNLIFSPYSVSQALGMLYMGARGDTASEIAGVLHWVCSASSEAGADLGQANALQADGLGNKDRSKDFILRVANALWVGQKTDAVPDFGATIRRDFGGAVEQVNFDDAAAAVATINRWVKEHTEGKIPSILDSSANPSNHGVVLTNAIYFNGRWLSPFDKDRTAVRDFHVVSGVNVRVPTMSGSGHFEFADADGVKVLSMPYQGGASMILVLPDRQDGLVEVEAGLTADTLARWLATHPLSQVEVSLPRFRSETSVKLREALQELGMERALDSAKADFTGIADTADERLFVGDVVHKAFVDTDEGGTEAAASTLVAIAASARSAPAQPVRFVADHPFLYLIRDDRSGAILFIGRVVDPSS